MADEKNNTSSLSYKKVLVIRSLRRSKVRKNIAEYLLKMDTTGSYTSEIANGINTAPTNVIGAIRGMSTRYRTEDSLIALDIVKQINSDKNVKIYKLTEFGKDIIVNFQK